MGTTSHAARTLTALAAMGLVLCGLDATGFAAEPEKKPEEVAPAATASSSDAPAVEAAAPSDAEKSSDAQKQSDGQKQSDAEKSEEAPKPAEKPLDPDSQDPPHVEPGNGALPLPLSRKIEIAPLVGLSYRGGDARGIHYRPGLAVGGSARIEVATWLGVRLMARQEWLPVDVESGGFDTKQSQFDFDFRQPNLEVFNAGVRLEPTWVVQPRLRLFGIVGMSWSRMAAPAPQASGFRLEGVRVGNETNIPVGIGGSYEVIQNWLALGVSGTYAFSIDQRGTLFEPLQAIVDGGIEYLAPLPKPENAVDLLFTVGVIL